ncbi:hypothetical protein BN439_2183 [Erwinia amylovora Ea644]|nr:hypothetical protein BN439_2183 [Erwinia amylovora Ea644]CCP07244.1 hypothetical protein BN440_2221 [Erwinia amylovora MR1]
MDEKAGKRCCHFVSAVNSSSPMDMPDEFIIHNRY